jgi:protein-S-isoprenylcysteine O-methyltransferase Ste14
MLKKTIAYSLPVVGLCSFFFVQAYVVGFLLNVVVPKTIDSGPEGPVARAFVVDGFLLALFGMQHSIMARPAFKKWLTRFIPEQFERSLYVILSSAAMAAMMFHWQPLKHPVWSVTQAYATALFYGLFAAGCLILGHSVLVIGGADLLGFRQAGRSLGREPSAPPEFTTPGLYRYIRHPMMTGTLLVFWSTPVMSVGHFLFAAAMTCYVFVGIAFEERDLIKVYGERYRSYKQRVGMLLPSWKRNIPTDRARPW